jgi:hypothetical protein
MTVQELIQELQRCEPTATVKFVDLCSDAQALEDIQTVKVEFDDFVVLRNL